ncbi:MAG: hypothetical protein KC493_17275 [Bacteriovoracaceae bacterium]|nr:hypothetical protein [Bacteriovoracaceae bacterium]
MKMFLFFIFILTSTAQADQLEEYCLAKKGQLSKSYKCPKSGLRLPVKTCEYKTLNGDIQFVNGCSGPSGGHSELFFDACIQHDLCYHHEPSTNGFDRKYCDQLFLNIALKSCVNAPEKKKCERWANIMYSSLRVIGGPAFHCADSPSTY